MPFERAYVLQLVAIIVGSLTRTPARQVTPTLRALVNTSWQSMCRLGIRLPLLDKLVATSQKPTAWHEAIKGVEEAVRAWQASSAEVARMREILALKVEGLSNNLDLHDQTELNNVERLNKFIAAKEEEVQNCLRIFQEMKDKEIQLTNLVWCTFP